MTCVRRITMLLVAVCLSTNFAFALDPADGDLYCRVVDVGAGQCCIIKIPGKVEGDDHYIVYDAGNFQDRGNTAIEAVRDIIPNDERIDLLVLSHTDADHNAAVPAIVDEYFIDAILRTGQTRSGNITKTLKNARKAIQLSVDEDETVDMNLSDVYLFAGSTRRYGDAFVTMVCGFADVEEDWDINNKSERHNAISICVRIVFKGKSIFLCGDAVGRHLGQADNTPPIATEKFMLEQSGIIPIDSDVLVAAHHGADNGSSMAFIQAVTPSHVIFCAGHKHEHPRATTAERFLAAGIDRGKMFRTDRGDNEGGNEWPAVTPEAEPDRPGDDDIDVVIRKNGTVEVEYRVP